MVSKLEKGRLMKNPRPFMMSFLAAGIVWLVYWVLVSPDGVPQFTVLVGVILLVIAYVLGFML